MCAVCYDALSVQGPENDEVNDAVEMLSKKIQIPVVVSAGNKGRDACHVR